MTVENPVAAPEANAARLTSLTIFFPCHNEEENVERVVAAALDVGQRVAEDVEVVVIDDGSEDGTAAVTERMAAEDPRVRLVRHPENLGYGAALKSGLQAATKDYVFFTDGDGQFDLQELPKLVGPMVNDECDLALGYRLKRADPFIRSVNAALYRGLIRLLFGLKVRDIDCAFKLMRRSAIEGITLEADGALISAELLIKASKAGLRFHEVGVHHYPRQAGKQSGASLGVILKTFLEIGRQWRHLR